MTTSKINLLVLSGVLLCNNALARDQYFESQASVSVGFDDNPGLQSPVDEDVDNAAPRNEVFEDQTDGRIGGNIRFASESASDLFAIDLGVGARRFSDSELDSEFVETTFLYDKSGEKRDYGIVIGFTKDSTLETELEDTGTLLTDVDRNEVYIRPSFTSRLSPTWTAEVEFEYLDTTFDGAQDSFVEFEELNGLGRLKRIISERLNIVGTVGFIRYEPTDTVLVEQIEKEDLVQLLLGLEYRFSESLEIGFSAGSSDRDTYILGEDGSTHIDDTNPVYNFNITHTGIRNTTSLSLSDTFLGSADGGLSQSQRLAFTFIRPETFGGRFSLQATYIKTDPVRADTIERDYYSISPGLDWDIKQNLTFSTNLSYRNQELNNTDPSIDSSEADSTSITFGLRYDFGRKRLL